MGTQIPNGAMSHLNFVSSYKKTKTHLYKKKYFEIVNVKKFF